MEHRNVGLIEQAEERIKKYKSAVEADPYRLIFHLMPPVGLMNDPNGFIQYKGRYHVFYQWNPFKTAHGAKFWVHYSSSDLIRWKPEPIALAPSQWYEKNGCYSGSAIEYQGKLVLFYTGNVKDHQNNRESYQAWLVSEDGISFSKLGPVLEKPPEYTAHFRDPKVGKMNNLWYMVIGTQTHEEQGRIALFTSEDVKDWKHKGSIPGSELNGLQSFGYMWECPDLFIHDWR